MSKRNLKKYLKEVKKVQLEDQIMDLYDRFKEVKAYYDFAFNPKEEKLLEESKFKISKEYFPIGKRKPKLRRSVAQKIIKNCIILQVDPQVISEIMIFNIEIAITYSEEKSIKQEAFYISMLKSFKEATEYIEAHHLLPEYEKRIVAIADKTQQLSWFNYRAFEKVIDR